ncbi:hypothetical protein pb186bvf_004598 [Paramecium bursaria]
MNESLNSLQIIQRYQPGMLKTIRNKLFILQYYYVNDQLTEQKYDISKQINEISNEHNIGLKIFKILNQEQDLFSTNQKQVLYVEYIKQNLQMILDKQIQEKKQFSESLIYHFTFQICQQLSLFRQSNFNHKDLRPINILIDENHKLYVPPMGTMPYDQDAIQKFTEFQQQTYIPFEYRTSRKHKVDWDYVDSFGLGLTILNFCSLNNTYYTSRQQIKESINNLLGYQKIMKILLYGLLLSPITVQLSIQDVYKILKYFYSKSNNYENFQYEYLEDIFDNNQQYNISQTKLDRLMIIYKNLEVGKDLAITQLNFSQQLDVNSQNSLKLVIPNENKDFVQRLQASNDQVNNIVPQYNKKLFNKSTEIITPTLNQNNSTELRMVQSQRNIPTTVIVRQLPIESPQSIRLLKVVNSPQTISTQRYTNSQSRESKQWDQAVKESDELLKFSFHH